MDKAQGRRAGTGALRFAGCRGAGACLRILARPGTGHRHGADGADAAWAAGDRAARAGDGHGNHPARPFLPAYRSGAAGGRFVLHAERFRAASGAGDADAADPRRGPRGDPAHQGVRSRDGQRAFPRGGLPLPGGRPLRILPPPRRPGHRGGARGDRAPARSGAASGSVSAGPVARSLGGRTVQGAGDGDLPQDGRGALPVWRGSRSDGGGAGETVALAGILRRGFAADLPRSSPDRGRFAVRAVFPRSFDASGGRRRARSVTGARGDGTVARRRRMGHGGGAGAGSLHWHQPRRCRGQAGGEGPAGPLPAAPACPWPCLVRRGQDQRAGGQRRMAGSGARGGGHGRLAGGAAPASGRVAGPGP